MKYCLQGEEVHISGLEAESRRLGGEKEGEEAGEKEENEKEKE